MADNAAGFSESLIRSFMKKVIFGILAVAVLVAGVVFVVAQKRAHSGEKGFGFGPGQGHMAGMMLRGLNLTDDQKAKVKGIFETSHASVEPVMASMKENRQKMTAATANGAFDQAQIEAIATEQGNLMAKMIVERERAKSQVFAILTDEQKAKAAEMRQKFEEHMKGQKGAGHKPEGSEF